MVFLHLIPLTQMTLVALLMHFWQSPFVALFDWQGIPMNEYLMRLTDWQCVLGWSLGVIHDGVKLAMPTPCQTCHIVIILLLMGGRWQEYLPS